MSVWFGKVLVGLGVILKTERKVQEDILDWRDLLSSLLSVPSGSIICR